MSDSEEDFWSMCGNGGMSECQDARTPLDRVVGGRDLDLIRTVCRKYGFTRKRTLYYVYEIPALVQIPQSGRRARNSREEFDAILDILEQEGCNLGSPVRKNTKDEVKYYSSLDEINIINFIICEWDNYSYILFEALIDRGLRPDMKQLQVLLTEEDIQRRIEQWPKLADLLKT